MSILGVTSTRERPDGATRLTLNDDDDDDGRDGRTTRAKARRDKIIDPRRTHKRIFPSRARTHAPITFSETETRTHASKNVDVLLGDDANPRVGARGDANVGTPNDGARERNEIYPGRRATHRGDRARRG